MSKRAAVVLGVVGALTVVGTALFGTGDRVDVAAVLLAHACALTVAAAGLRRHRPARPAGFAVLAVIGTSLAACLTSLLTGCDSDVTRWGVLATQVVALGLLPPALRTLRRAGEDPRVTWPDLLLTTCGGGLVAVEVVGMLNSSILPDQPVVLAGAVAEIALAIVLLRLFTTRARMAPATVLVLLASCWLLATAAVVPFWGTPLTPYRNLLMAMQCLVVLLLAAAAHRSIRLFGTPAAGGHLRRDGQRLLSVLPVFCAVPVLWVLGAVHVLPGVTVEIVAPSGFVLACMGVGLAAQSVRRAERSAERDPLTDLVNRRGLPKALAELRQRLHGQELHLCMVDLDDFKQINETRGHAIGDALLIEVACRLRRAVGANGVVSRTGGDEFIVVCRTSPEDDDGGPADLLLSALDHPLELDGLPYAVSASIGITALGTVVPLDDALVDADIAMYAAKQAGKGRAQLFRQELRERVLGGLTRQHELRRLLYGGDPADVGELVVLHQPIVEIGAFSPRIVGVEALVRWRHPRAGLLTPDEFLPHAEAAGLGARLDEHVAAQAVGHLAHWDRMGLPELHVAVNLGVGSLHRHGMGRWLSGLAADHGIRPDRVHLEITEHEELPDDPRIAESLSEVVAAGFLVNLDDFGIGYTSLSYMRRFPISTVKLDRSITALVTGQDISLLEGIVALCRAMDLRILAEGVEREEQLGPLLALGIGYAQGHWFGTAMPAEDIPGFVRRIGGAGGATATDGLLLR